METAYRVAVVLTVLAAVLLVSAGRTLQGANHWNVLDGTAIVEQSSGGGERPSTRNVYVTYKDEERARAETHGIVGLFVRYYVAILVAVAIAAVWIAVWTISRRSIARTGRRR